MVVLNRAIQSPSYLFLLPDSVGQAQGRYSEAARHLAKLDDVFNQRPHLLEDKDNELIVHTWSIVADTYESLGSMDMALKWDEAIGDKRGPGGILRGTACILHMTREPGGPEIVPLDRLEYGLLKATENSTDLKDPIWGNRKGLSYLRRTYMPI